jgi:cytochrome c biogenesis protein CcmG, thiol:disulfide interchange protein DsbE
MTSKSRSSRRDATRKGPEPTPPVRWVLPVAGLVIALAAVIAIVLSQSGSGAAASVEPSAAVVTPPTITGTPLPDFSATADDPAKGQAAPVVAGHDYQGNAVGIDPSGKPTLVIFAAHWCPHCQREIPIIQAWIDAGSAPAGVDLVSVSTGIDPSLPNYPPEAWFERVGWTVPVIVDPTSSVAAAYGLTSYPYFVLLDGEGKVVSRASGELSMPDLEALLATATGS